MIRLRKLTIIHPNTLEIIFIKEWSKSTKTDEQHLIFQYDNVSIVLHPVNFEAIDRAGYAMLSDSIFRTLSLAYSSSMCNDRLAVQSLRSDILRAVVCIEILFTADGLHSGLHGNLAVSLIPSQLQFSGEGRKPCLGNDNCVSLVSGGMLNSGYKRWNRIVECPTICNDTLGRFGETIGVTGDSAYLDVIETLCGCSYLNQFGNNWIVNSSITGQVVLGSRVRMSSHEDLLISISTEGNIDIFCDQLVSVKSEGNKNVLLKVLPSFGLSTLCTWFSPIKLTEFPLVVCYEAGCISVRELDSYIGIMRNFYGNNKFIVSDLCLDVVLDQEVGSEISANVGDLKISEGGFHVKWTIPNVSKVHVYKLEVGSPAIHPRIYVSFRAYKVNLTGVIINAVENVRVKGLKYLLVCNRYEFRYISEREST